MCFLSEIIGNSNDLYLKNFRLCNMCCKEFLFFRVSVTKRMIMSLVAMILFFSTTTVFVKVNTDSWQPGFFGFTMVGICIINMVGAIFQGGLFGLAGMFPIENINAVGKGLSVSGVFTSVAQILARYTGASPISSALIYFLIADVLMILTLIVYLYVSKTVRMHEIEIDKCVNILFS